jgi:hypothetical protein
MYLARLNAFSNSVFFLCQKSLYPVASEVLDGTGEGRVLALGHRDVAQVPVQLGHGRHRRAEDYP